MDGQFGSEAKVEQPHKAFEHPAEVVADPTLSKDEKRVALDSLEQDARQLVNASGEGMDGGEDANLREVLLAKKTLELPPAELAFAVVMQRFEAKLAEADGTGVHKVITQAIVAMKAALEAIDRMEERPDSQQELNEELAKEKLDP
jgi:aminopeptidase N